MYIISRRVKKMCNSVKEHETLSLCVKKYIRLELINRWVKKNERIFVFVSFLGPTTYDKLLYILEIVRTKSTHKVYLNVHVKFEWLKNYDQSWMNDVWIAFNCKKWRNFIFVLSRQDAFGFQYFPFWVSVSLDTSWFFLTLSPNFFELHLLLMYMYSCISNYIEKA